MTPREQIAQIDKQITAVVREVKQRYGKFDTSSAEAWQRVWDMNPDLDARHEDLYRQRGNLQKIRDQQDYEAAKQRARKQRWPRPKKCPTCGQHTYAH